MSLIDRRLHALRDDLADARLQGRVQAPRFVEGRAAQVAAAVAPLRRRPAADAMLDTQALMGERAQVFEEAGGWSWVQLENDGYVGYLPSDVLSERGPEPTHRVCTLATFLYPAPDIKRAPLARLPFGARLTVTAQADRFAETPQGFVWGTHVAPLDAHEEDWVAVSERFVGVPYLWGGRTPDGIDCSGLVQAALHAAGTSAPRDSDLQEALGRAVDREHEARVRGDLVFWRGNVGIMLDGERLLHANGHHMTTVVEPLAEAVERIKRAGEPVTAVRRLA